MKCGHILEDILSHRDSGCEPVNKTV